jgi:serine/threonine protein phosphatase PrpC
MELVTAVVCGAASADGRGGADQVLIAPHLGLVAVADAPNGGDDGRAAARLALELVRSHLDRNNDVLERFRRTPAVQLRGQVLSLIEEAFARAAQDVFAFARRRSGVVVTLDVALLLEHEAFVGHVGDGRIYLVRRGLVHQLTIDHSRGDEAVQFDEIADPRATPVGADARGTRALGPVAHVRVETLSMELASEDRFVLCAASVHRSLPESLLHTRLSSEHLAALPEILRADAQGEPILAACAQVGSGEPFAADSAQARLALLAPMPLLAHCTEKELRLVAQATTPRRFAANTVVFEEGEVGTELYLLIAGTIAVSKGGAEIAQLGPGSVFGEMAMLDDPVRSATTCTVEDSELMVISRKAFFAMLRSHPMLAVKILWNLLLGLSANLRRTNERLADLERELGRRLVG